MFNKIIYIILLVVCIILSISKVALNTQWDISQNKISSVSDASKKLLDAIDEQLIIDVYSPNINVINSSQQLLQRYANYSSNIKLNFHNNIIEHNLAAKFKLVREDNMIITYKNAQQAIDIKLSTFAEQQISTLIYKTMHGAQRWAVFLTGHGETDAHDTSALGLSQFTSLLSEQGLRIGRLNLAQEQQIPRNTDLLIIVNPQHELLPIESEQISTYLKQGGNMLWLTEPESPATQMLQQEFGIRLAPGVAVDPSSLNLGSPHPAIKIITQYPKHTITSDIKSPSILPWSGHIETDQIPTIWHVEPFLTSSVQSWMYTGNATDDVSQLAQHKGALGPLQIGVALTSTENATAKQRILFVADSTFITNKYLGLYANKQLATNLMSWLQATPLAFTYAPTAARDFSYAPNNFDRFLYRYGFPLIVPLLLIFMGFGLHRHKALAEERN